MISRDSPLWQYLSDTQRDLVSDGELLIEDRKSHPNERLSDYSYLVFPYAKLYEGFLKQVCLDLGIISERDYNSTHFRLGKVLSPNLVRRLGRRSAYGEVRRRYGENLADLLWSTWREGRNLVFHYFPHNVRKLEFSEAVERIEGIVLTMEKMVLETNVAHRVSLD